MDDPEYRDEIGIDAELLRLAAKKLSLDLTEEHQYADGQISPPLLRPESVK